MLWHLQQSFPIPQFIVMGPFSIGILTLWPQHNFSTVCLICRQNVFIDSIPQIAMRFCWKGSISWKCEEFHERGYESWGSVNNRLINLVSSLTDSSCDNWVYSDTLRTFCSALIGEDSVDYLHKLRSARHPVNWYDQPEWTSLCRRAVVQYQ